MTTVFKKAVEIQVYNKPLCEWTQYNSEWNPKESHVRLKVPNYQRDFVWKEEDYHFFIASIFGSFK